VRYHPLYHPRRAKRQTLRMRVREAALPSLVIAFAIIQQPVMMMLRTADVCVGGLRERLPRFYGNAVANFFCAAKKVAGTSSVRVTVLPPASGRFAQRTVGLGSAQRVHACVSTCSLSFPMPT
jgi:hypothetical protein